LATLHYWGSNSDRWGHVSLTLEDNTHISFYPSNFSLWHLNSDPVYHDFLGADNIEEGSKPDIEIHLDNLDEHKIKAWWDNYKKTNPKFRGLDNNCSTVISQALEAGGSKQHVPEFGIVPIWSPDIVLNLGWQLQLAGQGVYIAPSNVEHVIK
jgi:hypothetical protein